ncbi:MFS transporter [Gracilibacillus halophilus]|uniref:MFS transporter n=1 Tax=Gracilibacillus halophilus TaxID=470864 RepID=UPI0003A0BAAD|nr:MFS transporter [Gracilibacillus halophilus]
MNQPIWTKNFISVSLVNLFIFTTFYSLLTTLPLYVIYQIGGTEAQGGLVVTAMLIAAIIMRPFSGQLLERFGKKRMLIGSAIAFAITNIGYFWMDQFDALMVLRFVHGISFAIVTTATSAIAADIVPAKRQGEGLGYFTMFMNVAVVIGPFIGLTVTQYFTFTALFQVLSCFAFVSIVFALLLKEPEQEKNTKPAFAMSLQELFEFRALPFSFIGLLVAFAYSGIISFISVFAKHQA